MRGRRQIGVVQQDGGLVHRIRSVLGTGAHDLELHGEVGMADVVCDHIAQPCHLFDSKARKITPCAPLESGHELAAIRRTCRLEVEIDILGEAATLKVTPAESGPAKEDDARCALQCEEQVRDEVIPEDLRGRYTPVPGKRADFFTFDHRGPRSRLPQRQNGIRARFWRRGAVAWAVRRPRVRSRRSPKSPGRRPPLARGAG